jgi:FMN phosphatase YigB (HAD superfamily)
MPRIRVVVFDVGETLIDETRHWGEWADWLGVPRFTFFAVLGGVIARGEHHRRVFDILRPGFDFAAEQGRREAAGWRHSFEASDFYPDALPCLARLRAAGYRVGLAGNQPVEAEASLAAAGAPADFIAASANWGVEKPSPAFFARVAETAGLSPHEIAYVGDHLDNDFLPARAAGLAAVFLRRGPWGLLGAQRPEAAQASLRVETLDELPGAFANI